MSTATETIEQFVNKEYEYGFVTDVDLDGNRLTAGGFYHPDSLVGALFVPVEDADFHAFFGQA